MYNKTDIQCARDTEFASIGKDARQFPFIPTGGNILSTFCMNSADIVDTAVPYTTSTACRTEQALTCVF